MPLHRVVRGRGTPRADNQSCVLWGGVAVFEHMDAGQRHSVHWRAVAREEGSAKSVDTLIDAVLVGDNFTATTDFPASLIYAELAARFPAAKVTPAMPAGVRLGCAWELVGAGPVSGVFEDAFGAPFSVHCPLASI